MATGRNAENGKENKKQSIFSRIIVLLLKIIVVAIETVLLAAIVLYAVMFMLTKGPSKSARDLFVMSVRETSAIGFLAEWFLSEDEIKKMMDDAQAHAEEDKKKKEAADIKNRADSLVYQTEKQLKENGDKIPDDIKTPLQNGIEDLKKAIADNDTERMDSIMKDMESKLHAFAQELYKNAQAQGGQAGPGFTPPNGGEQKGGNDDYIDVDEKK